MTIVERQVVELLRVDERRRDLHLLDDFPDGDALEILKPSVETHVGQGAVDQRDEAQQAALVHRGRDSFWWEVDVSDQTIKLLAWLHIGWDVREPPASVRAKGVPLTTAPGKSAGDPTPSRS